jgi:hypothetical protein
MIENNLERKALMRCKDLFPKVHVPLREGYVSIEELVVGKNSLIMNNPDLMLRKSILTKNDAITQHK